MNLRLDLEDRLYNTTMSEMLKKIKWNNKMNNRYDILTDWKKTYRNS